MCGIAGMLGLAPRAPAVRVDELTGMLRAIAHRGPDGQGTYVHGPIGLGHVRLSIIDPQGGAQPLANEDESVWVVFNGEIFNYRELRQTLIAQGHRFRTDSDTEVLVHLYEQHGDRLVDHLNGQFAFALWDQNRRRLLLARDRVGIRPLFYTEAAGRLIFGSEIKALFTCPEVIRRLDPTALSQVFSYWSVLPPATVFEGVHTLPPGCLLAIEADGRRQLTRYWDWDLATADPIIGRAARNFDECAEELRELLIDAVRLQLRADVPVGAYLSGGLDSSIITSMIRSYSDTPLRSFSLAFDDPEFDERGPQEQMRAYLGTPHSRVLVSQGDIAASFARTVWHAETPLLRTAPTPMLLLADHARSHGYKVVLTGEGADEVFAGYDLFKEAKVRRFMARQPDSRWRPSILRRLYPYLKHSPVQASAMTQRQFSEDNDQQHQPWFAHATRMASTRRALRFFHADLQARVNGWDPHQFLSNHLPAGIGDWPPLGRDQYVEAHTLMSGYLLAAQGDRMAMAASIEGRYPFLDHRVIEFANRLPPAFKLHGLTEKAVLKKAAVGLLPAAIRQRSKQPYRAPDSASFFHRGELIDFAAELLSRGRLDEVGLFDSHNVTRLVEKCRAGKAIGFSDNMAFVGVLSTMLLHDQFVRPACFDQSGMA